MRLPFRQFPALALALLSLPAAGQNSQANQLLPAISSLRRLTQDSGYIFDGTVLSVQAAQDNSTELATVQITFRVEQAIRGTRTGQILTIREWAGLWNSGERLVAGDLARVLRPPDSTTAPGRRGTALDPMIRQWKDFLIWADWKFRMAPAAPNISSA